MAFRIDHSTTCQIFDEVSSALYEVLKDDYLGIPEKKK
jgi:hypothetical protein